MSQQPVQGNQPVQENQHIQLQHIQVMWNLFNEQGRREGLQEGWGIGRSIIGRVNNNMPPNGGIYLQDWEYWVNKSPYTKREFNGVPYEVVPLQDYTFITDSQNLCRYAVRTQDLRGRSIVDLTPPINLITFPGRSKVNSSAVAFLDQVDGDLITTLMPASDPMEERHCLWCGEPLGPNTFDASFFCTLRCGYVYAVWEQDHDYKFQGILLGHIAQHPQRPSIIS